MTLSIIERRSITRQVDAGCPIKDIADDFDLSVSQVLAVARRYRQHLLTIRRKVASPPPLAPETLEPIRYEASTYEWHSPCGYAVTLPLLSIQRG